MVALGTSAVPAGAREPSGSVVKWTVSRRRDVFTENGPSFDDVTSMVSGLAPSRDNASGTSHPGRKDRVLK